MLGRSSTASIEEYVQKIPRDVVAEFIDGYLICLISLIQENNQSSDTQVISFLAELCSSTNIFQKSSEICRLAKAYLLLGDFKKSYSYNTEAYNLAQTSSDIKLSTVCFYWIFIAVMDFQASVALAKQRIQDTDFIFFLKEVEQRNYLFQWQTNYAVGLIENGQYFEAVPILAELPVMDFRIILELICRYYLFGHLFNEIWLEYKQVVFQSPKVSEQKIRMVLECAWIYGEREFCIRRSQVLLMEPSISLPMYRYYKEVYESFAEGKFPYFSFNEQLLKTFEADAEHYYDLFYDCRDQQELDNYYTISQKAIYNGIALARKMGLEVKLAQLLKRLEFINGVYKQLS